METSHLWTETDSVCPKDTSDFTVSKPSDSSRRWPRSVACTSMRDLPVAFDETLPKAADVGIIEKPRYHDQEIGHVE